MCRCRLAPEDPATRPSAPPLVPLAGYLVIYTSKRLPGAFKKSSWVFSGARVSMEKECQISALRACACVTSADSHLSLHAFLLQISFEVAEVA
jgi:hypothetical protein